MALKRANGEGNLRKRSNGTWEARVTLGTDPKTGKLISKSVYARTQKECREKMKALLGIDGGQAATPPAAPKEPPKPRPEDVITVGQWLDTWLKEYLADVKPNTALQYESVVRLHLKPAFGDVLLKDLRTSMIQKFYNKMRDDGVSPKYIKNIHGILHKALQQAVLLNYLRTNPTNACILPKIIKKEIHPMDDRDTALFLEAIKGCRYELLLKVDLFTGLREGELLGLMWDCVDFDKGTILVNKQLHRSQKKGEGYYFAPPKNNKSRTIRPAPYVMTLLRQQKLVQTQMRLAAGPAWQESGLVFTNEFGRYISLRAVFDCFKRTVRKVGLPNLRIHDLRHTYAVNSIRAGDDIKTVQSNLGHATAAFTLDVYGHFTDDMRQASSQRMEQFISGVLGL
mgnify:CR=1 FL=1